VQPVPTCASTKCPTGAALISTDEGPVIVEEWPDNSVIVSESFDSALAAKLSSAIRTAPIDQRASMNSGQDDELSLRLFSMPAFRAFQERIEGEFMTSILHAARHSNGRH